MQAADAHDMAVHEHTLAGHAYSNIGDHATSITHHRWALQHQNAATYHREQAQYHQGVLAQGPHGALSHGHDGHVASAGQSADHANTSKSWAHSSTESGRAAAAEAGRQ